jgi:TRAP-type mannitol/chloroaromatic compound transport system substrate-binding protein
MRIPGLGGEIMKRLGVKTVLLPANRIYDALKSGAIEATEWVGPYDDEKLGFYQVAAYYYYPGWWEPGATLHAFVNKSAYAKLPSEYKAALAAAAREANELVLSDYDHKNPLALERLLGYGVALRPFPPEVLRLASREADALYQELAGKDATYARIYEAWNRARTRVFRWFGTNERVYADFAFPQV